MALTATDRLRFFGSFPRSPRNVGSVIPSSTWLASAMVAPIDFTAVHVNRAPADATVQRVERHRGAHLPAFDKDSERNERVRWQLETAYGGDRLRAGESRLVA